MLLKKYVTKNSFHGVFLRRWTRGHFYAIVFGPLCCGVCVAFALIKKGFSSFFIEGETS